MKTTHILLLLHIFNLSFCQIRTTKFDTQEWTTENLNVDSFSNGDKIVEAKSLKEWKDFYDARIPAYCYVNFSKVNPGKLYNYFAIIDNRKLAPKGFHIPSFDEWDILVKNCGGEYLAGGKLKSKSGWKNINNNQGNNLNIKPATILNKEGFDEIKNIRGETLYHSVYFWTTTTMSDNPQESKIIGFEDGSSEVIGYNFPYDHYLMGCYVRCIKDIDSSVNDAYTQNNFSNKEKINSPQEEYNAKVKATTMELYKQLVYGESSNNSGKSSTKTKKNSTSKTPTTRKCECCGKIFKISEGWGYKSSSEEIFKFNDETDTAYGLMEGLLEKQFGTENNKSYHPHITYCTKKCVIVCNRL